MSPVYQVTFALLVLGLSQSEASGSWSYESGEANAVDPSKWLTLFPHCGGSMQSPIDIQTSIVQYSPTLDYFDLSAYNDTDGISMELFNNGHTIEVAVSGSPIVIGQGGLPADYTLSQFHFHWGQDDDEGSEHSVDGNHFPMEMHLVHYMSSLGNSSYASSQPFGLAVIGFFFEIGDANPNFDQLLQYFGNTTNPDDEIDIATFALGDLLPAVDNLDFFRYSGSLTTPPCYESVIWSLSITPIIISDDQLDTFRSLKRDDHQDALVNNFRPTQHLDSRLVTTTDDTFSTCL